MISVNFFSKYLLLHQNAEVTKLYTIHAAWLDPIVLYLSFYVPLYSVGGSNAEWKCDTIFLIKSFQMNDGDVCNKPAILPWRQLHQYSTTVFSKSICFSLWLRCRFELFICHLISFFSYPIAHRWDIIYHGTSSIQLFIHALSAINCDYQLVWKNKWVISRGAWNAVVSDWVCL